MVVCLLKQSVIHCMSAEARLSILKLSVDKLSTLLSHTPSQLRLARSLARTTRARHKTETDFPIGGLLRRLFPFNLRSVSVSIPIGPHVV